MAIHVEDLGFREQESVNGGFVHTNFYVGLFSDITDLPEPADIETALSYADLVTVSTDITFQADKGFIKFKAIPESIDFNNAGIGSRRGRVEENKLKIEMIGSDAELLGFLRFIRNKDVVVLAQEHHSKNLRMVGSSSYPAWISDKSEVVESTVEGQSKITIIFSDKQNYTAPFYTGIVTEMPAAGV